MPAKPEMFFERNLRLRLKSKNRFNLDKSKTNPRTTFELR
jgi:hypothetical protein